MARMSGIHGQLQINGTTVLSLDKWSLDMKIDTYEVTSMGDSNKTYVPGLPDISGTFSGFYDDADTTLMAARATSAGGTPVTIALFPNTVADSGSSASGDAYLDVKVDVDVKGANKVSGSFKAAGAWAVNL